jgi:hypothetical protein
VLATGQAASLTYVPPSVATGERSRGWLQVTTNEIMGVTARLSSQILTEERGMHEGKGARVMDGATYCFLYVLA